jgi:hypothetical protein
MTEGKFGMELGSVSSAMAFSQTPKTKILTIVRARPIREWAGRIRKVESLIAPLYRASAHTLKR